MRILLTGILSCRLFLQVEGFSSLRSNKALLRTPTRMSCQDRDPLLTHLPPEAYNASDLPKEFAYPHHYQPHPIAIQAANSIKPLIESLSSTSWKQHNFGLDRSDDDAAVGKMFGVLVVQLPESPQLGFLKAYSGTLAGVTHAEEYGFCPIVYNRLDDVVSPEDGSVFSYQKEEAELNNMNHQVLQLENNPELENRHLHLKQIQDETQKRLQKAKAKQKEAKKIRQQQRIEMKDKLSTQEYEKFEADLIQQSAYFQRQLKQIKAECKSLVDQSQESLRELQEPLDVLKETRKEKSSRAQDQLFEQYRFLNVHGETKSLLPIFENTAIQRPPSGAGDCAAPKLLQHAFRNNYKPIAMAEFWWGKSPLTEVRKHLFWYPACRGKCEPILNHMLGGIPMEANPLDTVGLDSNACTELKILYEDPHMVVVNKPREMLSVPGRRLDFSVHSVIKEKYPNATGPLLVHRLDMSTSGLILIALTKDCHKRLQAQFINRTVKKRYTALLDGIVKNQEKGKINLPLSMDYINRPMQMVDHEKGKSAVTHYEIVNSNENGKTRILLYPLTGRTHQLRVHTAHCKGLDTPIVGDDIYGQRSKEEHGLCLHAGYIEFEHPVTKRKMTITSEAPF